MKTFQLILSLFVAAVLYSCAAPTVFCQAEKLGIVSYAAPKGWAKTPKENVVGFSEINQKTGGFCIITLYGATDGTGNPASDFTREWKRLVISNLKVEANPKTETQTEDGWMTTMGASAAEIDGGGKALAFLTVFTRDRVAVSVLGVFNEQSYLAKLETFIGSMEMDKTITPANNTTASNTTSNDQPTYDSNGKLIVPLPTRQLTVADFEGEWGEDASRVTTNYVYRSSGAYAGSDNLSFRSKMTITKNGGYINDFFAIQNGKKIIDKTNGTISVNGFVFSIKQADTQKFVIRGWLELSDMTIMIICGPLYDKDIARHIENPLQGANLNNIWVRKK